MHFIVLDMDCLSSADAVAGAVHRVDPDAEVVIDLEAKHVEVESRSAADDIGSAIADAGFSPHAI